MIEKEKSSNNNEKKLNGWKNLLKNVPQQNALSIE